MNPTDNLTLNSVTLNSPNPQALGRFYARLLGWEITTDTPGDDPAQLCQRAGHQPRPDPGQRAPAGHHRAARPSGRLRRPPGASIGRGRGRAPVRGAQHLRPGLSRASGVRREQHLDQLLRCRDELQPGHERSFLSPEPSKARGAPDRLVSFRADAQRDHDESDFSLTLRASGRRKPEIQSSGRPALLRG